MKTFIYTKESKKSKHYFFSYKFQIYRVKNNVPIHVDTVVVNSDVYAGGSSTIMNCLIGLKLIPKNKDNRYRGKNKTYQIIELHLYS